jgi:hypothetical protein
MNTTENSNNTNNTKVENIENIEKSALDKSKVNVDILEEKTTDIVISPEEQDKLKKEKIKDYHQKIMLNNIYSRSKPKYNKLIWDNIETADDTMIKYLNNKIVDTYRMRLNLVYNVLYSIEGFPIRYKKDVIKLFNILAPLSNEFSLGSYKWSYKIVDRRLFIHNSVTKVDFTDYFKMFFMNPIRKLLRISGIDYKYYYFKSTRYHRNIDIVFAFDFQ